MANRTPKPFTPATYSRVARFVTVSGLAHRGVFQLWAEAIDRSGHPGLPLNAIALLPLIGPEGARPVRLAEATGQSRQGVGQLLREMESRGFVKITRGAAPNSKHAYLTPLGQTLQQTSTAALAELEKTIGRETLDTLIKQLTPIGDLVPRL